MVINFVTEQKPYWILGRWCEEYCKRIPNSTITHLVPDYDADANVYVNYALYRPTKGFSLCVFTHREEDERKHKFDAIAQQCDWCFGQSDYTMSLLPPEKSSKLKIGVDEQFFRDRNLKIGVVGRNYESGRKRVDWLVKLNEIEGVDIEFTNGRWAYEDMPDFYDAYDYILIVAKYEGGPMVNPEAIARYKPLIVPVGVGWWNEYPAIYYNNYGELENIIRNLVPKRDSWEVGAKQILEKVRELCDN